MNKQVPILKKFVDVLIYKRKDSSDSTYVFFNSLKVLHIVH